MKRRILIWILALCSCTLWGCGENTATEPATEPEKLPVAAVELSEPYDLPVKEGLLVQNWLLSSQPDLLITDRLPETVTTPVLLVGSDPTDHQLVYTVDFAWDSLVQTQVSLLAQLPYQGDLNRDGVITYAILAPTGTDYKATCQAAMGTHTLLNAQVCLDDQAVGQQVAARILSGYGKDLDVLLCGSEALSLGASAASKDAGRVTNKDLILLTVGPDIPRSSGTVYADPQAMIDTILELAPAPADTLVPLTVITE